MAMTRVESWERFEEGLKKASSRLRELDKLVKKKQWEKVAAGLDSILFSGRTLYRSAPLTQAQIDVMIEDRVKNLRKAEDAAGTDKKTGEKKKNGIILDT